MKFIIGICNTAKNADAPKRMQPGDVIDFRPYSAKWKPSKKQLEDYRFITVDLESVEQADALCERYYDTPTLADAKDEYLTFAKVVAKRRFNINTLKKVIAVTEITDKLNDRLISINDNLTTVKPVLNAVKL